MHDGRTPAPDRQAEAFADADDPVVSAVALLVLGAGLGSLFGVPVLDLIDFWVIFAIGYAVVVPLTSLLRGWSDDADSGQVAEADASAHSDEDIDAALDRLRDRYARGELTEAQFERKLEALLETETPEDARERLDWKAGSDAHTDDAEQEFEQSR